MCVAVVTSLMEEMAAQNFACLAHGTADIDMHCLLRLMTHHLTSNMNT